MGDRGWLGFDADYDLDATAATLSGNVINYKVKTQRWPLHLDYRYEFLVQLVTSDAGEKHLLLHDPTRANFLFTVQTGLTSTCVKRDQPAIITMMTATPWPLPFPPPLPFQPLLLSTYPIYLRPFILYSLQSELCFHYFGWHIRRPWKETKIVIKVDILRKRYIPE